MSFFNLLGRKKYFSVRSRVLATVGLGLLLLSGLLYVLATDVLSKSYLAIEEEEVIQDVDRADKAINDELYLQYENLLDWSPWDDMYFYTEEYALEGTKNKEYEESTMFANGYIRQDQHAFFVSDNTGHIYYAVAVDLASETEVSSSTVVNYFEARPELIIHTKETDFTYGLVLMPDGPALFASKPSLHNDETGPVYSSIALLRYLDDGKVATVSEALNLPITMYKLTDESVSDDVKSARNQLLGGKKYVVTPTGLNSISGYKLINDVYGKPILVMRIDTTRPIFAQGQKTILFFMIGGFAALAAFALLIGTLLEKLVIRRFTMLTQDVEKINTEKDISMQVRTGAEDDIGRLSSKINQMLSWLSAAQAAEAKSRKKIVKLLKDVEHEKEHAEEMVIERTQELHDETARLLASINSLAFGFIIADNKGRVLLHNPVLTTMLGTVEVPSTIANLTVMLNQLRDENQEPIDLQALTRQAVLAKVGQEYAEFRYNKKSLRFLCTPILSDQTQKRSNTIGFVLIIDDITEAKNIERSREEFFSIASHELRTPLTAIRWNTHMLISENANKIEDTKKQALLKDVHAASSRLISIVDDFLEVSRLEQKKISVTKQAFLLNQLIIDSVNLLQETAKQKGLAIKLKGITKNSAIHAYGDSDRTKQVLDNLLGNALKYTDTGSVTVSVMDETTSVTVLIEDTGVGISEKNQRRLFKKFQQAGEDMLAREDGQSTGLGLYISKLVMEEMNGTIKLERSALNKGSVFSFTLPKSNT